MDGFMDRMTQELGTNDIIRANSEAEARELEETRNRVGEYEKALTESREQVGEYERVLSQSRERMGEYEKILTEMRRLNLKTVETNEMTNQLVTSGIERFEQFQTVAGESKDYSGDIEAIRDALRDQEEYIHKENVRVYRNVQASIVDELKLQTEALSFQNKALEGKIKGLKGLSLTSLILSAVTLLALGGYIVISLLGITF